MAGKGLNLTTSVPQVINGEEVHDRCFLVFQWVQAALSALLPQPKGSQTLAALLIRRYCGVTGIDG